MWHEIVGVIFPFASATGFVQRGMNQKVTGHFVQVRTHFPDKVYTVYTVHEKKERGVVGLDLPVITERFLALKRSEKVGWHGRSCIGQCQLGEV